MRSILEHQEIWVIPFIVLLLGDYVVEVVNEIFPPLLGFDRLAYADFVRRNRAAMRVLRAKATSYWDAHYREAYPIRNSYPGLAALSQLENWAS